MSVNVCVVCAVCVDGSAMYVRFLSLPPPPLGVSPSLLHPSIHPVSHSPSVSQCTLTINLPSEPVSWPLSTHDTVLLLGVRCFLVVGHVSVSLSCESVCRGRGDEKYSMAGGDRQTDRKAGADRPVLWMDGWADNDGAH